VLLTCPPYANKELWSEQSYLPAHEYVTEALKRFKADVYIFVVDDPGPYAKYVAEQISNNPYMKKDSTTEFVLVVDKRK
jgi:hypothetical protein